MVERDHWYALRFSYAGDDSVRPELETSLRAWASKRITRRCWPMVTLSAPPYRYDVVSMHLDEERHARVFNSAHGLRPLLMDSSDQKWCRTFQPLYEEIRLKYLGWLSMGRSQMLGWLQCE